QSAEFMNREDRKVAIAVGRQIPWIGRAVDAIVAGIRKGGRLIYMGAGSSGRMAVLDAAECQPTFGAPPQLVQALIAGGERAITQAVEGAGEDVRRAERELRRRKSNGHDGVVGVRAGGTRQLRVAAWRFA